MFGVFSVLICHSHYEVNDPNWNICRSWTVVESPETHPCCHIMSRYSVQRSEREMILNDIQGCQIKRVRIGTGIASTLETTDVITDALTNDVYEANWDTHHHGTSQIICWYEGKNKSLTISTDTPSKSFFHYILGQSGIAESLWSHVSVRNVGELFNYQQYRCQRWDPVARIQQKQNIPR